MSESILNALVHLFSIIANYTDSEISEKGRDVVKSYLNKQLSRKQADEYIELFDNYLNFYKRDGSNTKSDKGRKKGTLSAVKVLKICRQINENLQQREKFIVLLRLIEFVNEDDLITPAELDFISTVSESFNISESEFEQIKALVTNEIEKIKEKDRILIIDSSGSQKESDGVWFERFKPFEILDFKYIVNENLDGKIIVLHIKSSDIYFFVYRGKSSLSLQGNNIIENSGYIFEHGSIIKGPKIKPIYYSEVVGRFLVSDNKERIILAGENINFRFKNSHNGVQDFSFSEESGQLIGIMGGSGVGKSTLLNVLNGKLKLSSGNVTINGYDIEKDKEHLEGVIGYVPQDDLLIEELTVYQNIYYNAKLCFSNFTEKQIINAIDKILKDLNLYEIKDLKVGNPLQKYISGGQRKRLNIGLELIREPSILFVDEPTSGLSSNDSEMLMLLLRQQATKGKLVIVNIHQPSSDIYKLFDKLWVMDQYGYIIYTGNPIDAIVYFKKIIEHVDSEESECPVCGNVNPEQILEIVEAKVVDEFGRLTKKRKKSSKDWFKLYKNFNENKIEISKTKEKLPQNFFKIPGLRKQFLIFTIRNILSKLTNTQYLLINFLEAPILAFILAYFTKYLVDGEYIFAENKNLPVYLFMSVVVALFIGLTVSAQEIIKDRNILERESFLNLSHFSYLNSKIAVLFIMSAIQVLSFVIVGNYILEIKGLTFNFWMILFTTAAFSNLIGLNISAGMNSIVNIYILIPFVLVPQLLLGGAMVNFDDLHESITNKEYVPVLGDIMVSRWAYEALAVEQFKSNKFEKIFFEEEKEKSIYQYKSVYLISELSSRLNRCVAELKTNKNYKGNLSLIKNEIEKICENEALKNIQKVDIEKFTDEYFTKDIAEKTKNYLDTLKSIFNEKSMLASKLRDDKFNELLKKMGKDEIYNFQQKYYNKSIADLVLNKMQFKKIIEYKGKLVQKKDPVFIVPESNFGRAQFYASSKKFLGYQFDTFWFNILVIWFGTFLLYLALLFDLLRRILSYFENFRLRKNHD
ncbi:MAG: ATP-binding cassette domain-containing protein [Bacteroidales bacterium]|nr:ATP-binding cassette domain-containing protein [Bacteroidales bacterium]MBN2757272.1 ATP-binding cassette domain-containing protein [Bacteroidales bacterium]